jgi:pyruvate dehydrogenase E1 component
LGGEGLQHQDGSSQVMAALIPNCRAYDPAFAGELAVILDHGARQMLERGNDVFYYLTVMNENYPQPSLPAGVAADVIRGLYRFDQTAVEGALGMVRLLGSGAILREVIAASAMLARDWQVATEVWSATSFSELARDARDAERWNRLHPLEAQRRSHVNTCLEGNTPIIAASDYVRAYPQLIASYVEARFITLGTDGFGRSDTRAALRRFFEVDRQHIVLAALQALIEENSLPREVLARALALYSIDSDISGSWMR